MVSLSQHTCQSYPITTRKYVPIRFSLFTVTTPFSFASTATGKINACTYPHAWVVVANKNTKTLRSSKREFSFKRE